ncbi:hypothetical protein BHE74_00051267 [Ensete ventricosum]|nr:hypothetical protein GW17_00051319 [Ensete ventricosum]RWW43107.1 hypothetical protein BHE74_00051267 [Ensete ventricosum]
MAFDLGTMTTNPGDSTFDDASVVSINIFVVLLCACIVIGHLLEGNRWLNESITALIIVSASQVFRIMDLGALEIRDYFGN